MDSQKLQQFLSGNPWQDPYHVYAECRLQFRWHVSLRIDTAWILRNDACDVRTALIRRAYAASTGKKLVHYCLKKGIATTLPCYDSAHKYRGKTVVFRKPLFPGCVFLQLEPERELSARQNEHVANLLDVFDQELFRRQLESILLALEEEDLEVRLAPSIGDGMRVRIKSGPLRGVEGWVEDRRGRATVLLRLDFIGQAAAVNLDADQLEPS